MALSYASKGLAGTALGFGIGGTALGLANSGGLLSGLFGRNNNNVVMPGYGYGFGCCGDRPITQNELNELLAYQNQLSCRESQLAEAQSENAMLRESEKTNEKISDTYKNLITIIREQDKELQAQIRANELRLNKLDVDMQRTADAIDKVFTSLDQKINCCCDRMTASIQAEADRRACADNTVVNYINSTFQPNLVIRDTVTGGTPGIVSGTERTYNPLDKCGCGYGSNVILNPVTTTPAA